MTFEESARLVYVQGQIAAATIRMQSMIAENLRWVAQHGGPVYTEQDFIALIDEYGLGSNDLLREIHGR